MQIIRSVAELEDFVAATKNNGRSIGLVPTMGALHAGHLSLMHRAVKECDTVVASVFVNPTQFNNPQDLATYPRTEEEDIRLLAGAGVSVAFIPSVDEIYPNGGDEKHIFQLGRVAEVMEGAKRPGHFQGVAQIVSKLFRIVRPARAYFGEKDFQQIAVIKAMTESEHLDVEIIPCPIKRADDGLALSSRNALLTPAQRAVAPEIHKALLEAVEYSKTHGVRETIAHTIEKINSLPEMEVEYFEIVDARTLEAIDQWEESPQVQGCITVYCGKVRLIDNIAFF